MVKRIILTIVVCYNVASCTPRKGTESAINLKDSITTEKLLAKVVKLNLDSIISELGDKVLVIAKTEEIEFNEIIVSNNNEILLFTDTITFNKILVDSMIKTKVLPVFITKKIGQNDITLTIVLFDKETCYDFIFNKKLDYMNSSKYYVNFKYKLPFNN